jgi:Uma2 family endonuclease
MQKAVPRVTVDEYLVRERASETKHELVNGVVVAMAGASPRHVLIATNVTIALGRLLGSRPCLVLGSDQRVAVEATGLYTYPDATVVCERPRFDPKDATTLVNPLVIVEVLSDSTEAYDRGAKFAHYRSVPSLAEYVLVAQNERRVEHYRRLEGGQWLLTAYEGDDAKVALPALSVELAIREIYSKIELLDEAG